MDTSKIIKGVVNSGRYTVTAPIEIQLSANQLNSLYGQNSIWADTGNVALEYWAHP